jgi:hypothetical protein
VEITEILRETKSTHSSEYFSGSVDKTGKQRNRICNANSASARASESAQRNLSTSSSMAKYYREFSSQLTLIRRRAIYVAALEVLTVRTHRMCCAAGIVVLHINRCECVAINVYKLRIEGY